MLERLLGPVRNVRSPRDDTDAERAVAIGQLVRAPRESGEERNRHEIRRAVDRDVAHLLVNGEFVVRDGQLVPDALPGRPVRR